MLTTIIMIFFILLLTIYLISSILWAIKEIKTMNFECHPKYEMIIGFVMLVIMFPVFKYIENI